MRNEKNLAQALVFILTVIYKFILTVIYKMRNEKNLAQALVFILTVILVILVILDLITTNIGRLLDIKKFLLDIREWILSQNGSGILVFGFGFSLLFDSALKVGLSIFRKPFWVTPVLVMSYGGVIRGIEYKYLCVSLISIILYLGIGIGIGIWKWFYPETPQNQEH